MIVKKNQLLESKDKKPMVYDIYHTSTDMPKPVVLFCHGFKGFKDWGAWELVAKRFAEAGFFFIKFNFSHNGGTVEQPIDFPDLEAFSNNNYSIELNDLERVIAHVSSSEKYSNSGDFSNINLIGHSRGGGIALIIASENDSVKKVATWAGVSDFKTRFKEGSRDFSHWKDSGLMYVDNLRTNQKMPLKWQFYEDFIANEERLTIKNAVSTLEIPQLILHGDADTTLSTYEAEALHEWNDNSVLKIISGADHVFNAKHPWNKEQMPEALLDVVESTISFFK